ncbi:MAG: JAB domain-containing protein [Halioglobus sp.]
MSKFIKRCLQLNTAAVKSFLTLCIKYLIKVRLSKVTERLQAALALVDVKVLDHIVIGSGSFPGSVSMAERGML